MGYKRIIRHARLTVFILDGLEDLKNELNHIPLKGCRWRYRFGKYFTLQNANERVVVTSTAFHVRVYSDILADPAVRIVIDLTASPPGVDSLWQMILLGGLCNE